MQGCDHYEDPARLASGAGAGVCVCVSVRVRPHEWHQRSLSSCWRDYSLWDSLGERQEVYLYKGGETVWLRGVGYWAQGSLRQLSASELSMH